MVGTKPVSEMTHSDWIKFVGDTALPATFQPLVHRDFERRLLRARDVQSLVSEHFGAAVVWQDMSIGKPRYEAYLQSREWAAVVQLVRERSGGKCERCRWGPHEHTHHLTYERLYRERLEDLLAVCEGCHATVHSLGGDDPKRVEAWRHEEQARLLKTLATDQKFLRRLLGFLHPQRLKTQSSNSSGRSKSIRSRSTGG